MRFRRRVVLVDDALRGAEAAAATRAGAKRMICRMRGTNPLLRQGFQFAVAVPVTDTDVHMSSTATLLFGKAANDCQLRT